MMDYKELDQLLKNIIYSDDYQEHLVEVYKMDKYEKNNFLKSLITYFVLEDDFLPISIQLNKLISSGSVKIKDVVEYIRSYARRNPRSKGWYITSRGDRYTSTLMKMFPETIRDEITAKLMLILYKPLLDEIIKMMQSTNKIIISDKAVQLMNYLKCKDDAQNTTSKENYYVNCARVNYSVVLTQKLTSEFSSLLIKNKFSSVDSFCTGCLYRTNSFVLFDEIIGDTNKNTVDVLLVGMNPYKDEVISCKPFSGKAGQHLRSMINDSGLSQLNLVMFNTIPCFIENNQDPNDDSINRCTSYLMQRCFEELQPKCVLFLGDVALKGLKRVLIDVIGAEEAEKIVKDCRHSIIQTSKRLLSHTYHPSYLNYNHTKKIRDDIIDHFNNIYCMITRKQYQQSQKPTSSKNIVDATNNSDKMSIYKKISEEYVLSNVSLLDEKTSKSNYYNKRLVARFRRKDDYSKYFLMDVTDIDYEYYELKQGEYTPLKPIKDVIKKKIKFFDYINYNPLRKNTSAKLYESDIDELDYFYLKYGEINDYEYLDIDSFQVCYTDIEVFASTPVVNEQNCQHPIPVVTNIINDTIYVHCALDVLKTVVPDISEDKLKDIVHSSVNNMYQEIYDNIKDTCDKKFEVVPVIHTTEEQLLAQVIKQWSTCDVVTGWNSYFDVNYTVARYESMSNNGILLHEYVTDMEGYTKYNEHKNIVYKPHRSGRYGFYWLPGCCMIDLLSLYKNQEHLESYSLDYASKYEFDVGKVEIDDDIIKQAKEDLQRFVMYNIQDTLLAAMINYKKGLLDSVIGQSSVSYSCLVNVANTTLKPIDCLIIKTARKKGLVVRTAKPYEDDFRKVGGYVREPDKSVKKNVVCFDVASMYPNIIKMYNVSFDTYVGHICGQFIDNEDEKLKQIDVICNYIKDLKLGKRLNRKSPENVVVDFVLDPMTKNKKQQMTLADIADLIYKNDYLITPRGTVFKNNPDGLAVLLVTELLNKRKEHTELYKKNNNEKDKLLSQSFKILANAYYGAHGNNGFRFFSAYLTETIPLTGQLIIRTVQYLANEYIKESVQQKQ
jgi:DNA polymerase